VKKAIKPRDAVRLEQVPNIGPSIAADLRRIGVRTPGDLRGKDPLLLYRKSNKAAGRRQDPCLLDVFMAAVDFMDGKGSAPWHAFTAKRKALLS